MWEARMYRRYGKRVLDLISAVVLLIVLSPALVFIAIKVRRTLGAPVLFRQLRAGQDGLPFTVIKFRTMTDATDAHGHLLPDAARLTRFGDLLRRSSLDELPELFNVVKGEMSLVGPRPLLLRYIDRYTPEQMRRHAVKPGITGWAQINGRNAIDWETRFALDVWYVNHCSFWLDLRIVLLTGKKVLRSEGISQEGHVTMSEFMGSVESWRGSAP
jgi:lipopolysaccharide/colanic/teichoic acid biosynthesis glycosyltransferase